MTSVSAMIKRISGLAGTRDVSAWENEFIRNVVAKTLEGTRASHLSEKQLEIIQRIHGKHFEDAA